MNLTLQEKQEKIKVFIQDKHIPAGLGSENKACTIASINLAIYGKLTDDIPVCVCPIIGKWVIKIQDVMPDEMRNSSEWKNLIPLLVGTKNESKEKRRLDIMLDWMWTIVLPQLQPIADKYKFGMEWQKMLKEKNSRAAAAYAAAHANTDITAAADAACAAAAAHTHAAAYWIKINPCLLLQQLIQL